MNANTPTDVTFSVAGFAQRGGRTDHHDDGWGIAFFEGLGLRHFVDHQPACDSPVAELIRRYPIKSRNVVAHRFTAQWPVGVWRAPMRLEMDGDHLPALGQFGQIAPEAVWVDAPVKKNERLAGAMHAVKDMLAVDVGKILF